MLNKQTKHQTLKDVVKNIKMVDAGKTPVPYKPIAVNTSSAPKKYYPSIFISAEQAPFLTTHKVGDECTFVIKAKIVSHSKNESSSLGNTRDEYSLDICKIGHEDHSK